MRHHHRRAAPRARQRSRVEIVHTGIEGGQNVVEVGDRTADFVAPRVDRRCDRAQYLIQLSGSSFDSNLVS